jgi:hypothetical protein
MQIADRIKLIYSKDDIINDSLAAVKFLNANQIRALLIMNLNIYLNKMW